MSNPRYVIVKLYDDVADGAENLAKAIRDNFEEVEESYPAKINAFGQFLGDGGMYHGDQAIEDDDRTEQVGLGPRPAFGSDPSGFTRV